MHSHLTESRLANRGARAVARAFDRYQDRFGVITKRARTRFEQRDWRGMQTDLRERLDLYREVVDHATGETTELLGDRVDDQPMWVSIKAVYSGLIADRDDWELAETFFNSITRRVFTTVGVDPRIEFVATDFAKPPTKPAAPVAHLYERTGSTAALIESILTDFRFRALYQDIRRDAKLVALAVESHLRALELPSEPTEAEMIRQVFYRGKGAYMVGRLRAGGSRLPLVMALRHESDGVVVDAVLMDERDISILFSFTRSYFHVETERPYELVRFLKSLVPAKRIAELYTSIGYHKHGKTELYRDLLAHLATTEERFELAPGDRGLVMAVFTMPGFDMVFKVLRDRFGAPKQTTRRKVMAKYRLVFRHDRAGRLIDAHDFQHLELDRRHFDDTLLTELLNECGRAVEAHGDRVVIRHAYVERRVVPLNLYLRAASDGDAERAVVDYGQAVRDLAASNIFPGDMLLKNFGVTRHGRVVFYDYDELAEITELKFRALPDSDNTDEELASEPWFGVGENDLFPAEFRNFLGMPPPLRAVYEAHHTELFDPAFWQGIQGRLHAGEIIEIWPYEPDRRLHGD